MTIEEAIKFITPLTKDASWIVDSDLREALKLGIEALELVRRFHKGQVLYEDELLPGETKE